jgi:hypothetical protein
MRDLKGQQRKLILFSHILIKQNTLNDALNFLEISKGDIALVSLED